MNDDDLAELRVRVIQARTRFAAIPEIGVGELGPPDPETGERWNRLHVLGHLAEALPFWTGEIRKGLGGEGWIGRGEGGNEIRAAAIDSGPASEEAGLRARVRAGIDGLLAVLAEAEPSDLSREVEFRGVTGTSSRSLRSVLEGTLVGHLEIHVRQVEELTPTSAKS
jgi:DinB superfamily